ncbi:MAG: hypothetical protein B6D34_02300 [Candidatus Brocadia sp. UTAMX1]|nr:MAG: hypothetical protein B6D34_02300 [Candidatus Brocadia sp. UTAMX1]
MFLYHIVFVKEQIHLTRSASLPFANRQASEGNVSIAPCHPSYMAPAFTTTGLSPVRKQYPFLGTPIIKV